MTGGAALTRATRRLGRQDLYIALIILVVAWTGCRLYLPAFRSAGGRGMSYYDEFGPAVMAACGRGLVNPAAHSVPALEAFLVERSASFDCRSLGRLDTVPLDDFQGATRNLLLAAAAIWRFTGISWTALDNLAAMMFGVTLTAAYVVMRFVMARSLAAFGTFIWAISPMHLANVPHLRDYSKAPFFVLTALAIAAAIRAQRPRTLLAVGAAFGIIQGLGFGMRTDVGLNFAPFLVALLVLGSGEVKKNIPWKIAAGLVSLCVFVIVGWPVLSVYRHSEGLWHVSLLGLTTPFDNALNLRRAPYDFGSLYDDSYISTVVHAYWYRVHGGAQVSLHDTGMYDQASREYYGLLVSTFPADFMTRMAGSALHVLTLPFSITYGIVPAGFTHPMARWLAALRGFVMLALAGMGPIAAAYLLVLIGIRDRIAAAVGFVVLMFWAAYPYLQFQPRHVFHLEIVTIVVLLWAAQLSWRMIADAASTAAWRRDAERGLQSLAMIAAFAGIGVLCLGVARVVQQPRARALFEHYADAAPEPIDVQAVTDNANRMVRLSPSMFEPAGPNARIQQAMLVLDVAGACGASDIRVHVRYESAGTTGVDFSRDLSVPNPARAGSTRVFVPVYSVEMGHGRLSRFVSVDVPAASATCIRPRSEERRVG